MSAPASISLAQFEVYEEFNGDADMYQRRGTPKRETLGDIWGAWGAIEDLSKALVSCRCWVCFHDVRGLD